MGTDSVVAAEASSTLGAADGSQASTVAESITGEIDGASPELASLSEAISGLADAAVVDALLGTETALSDVAAAAVDAVTVSELGIAAEGPSAVVDTESLLVSEAITDLLADLTATETAIFAERVDEPLPPVAVIVPVFGDLLLPQEREEPDLTLAVVGAAVWESYYRG